MLLLTTSQQLLRAEKNVNSLLTAMQRDRGDRVNPAAQTPQRAPKPVWKKSHRRTVVIFPDFLEHDPEKWLPVFRKDHAQTKRWSGMTFRRKVIAL